MSTTVECVVGPNRPVGAACPLSVLRVRSGGRCGHGGRHEAYVPAQQSSPVPQARFSSSDEYSRRTSDSQVAASQGSLPPLGVTGRLRGRSEFARLRNEGHRSRSAWLWCSVVRAPDITETRVAYAIGRQCGIAVLRNRTRRRLRHLVRDHASHLGPGWYLFGVNAPGCEASFRELEANFEQVLRRVARREGR